MYQSKIKINTWEVSFFFFFIFFLVLGIESRASHKLGKYSTLSYTPSPVSSFFLSFFKIFKYFFQYWGLNSGPQAC
jgi:hypothetical protein